MACGEEPKQVCKANSETNDHMALNQDLVLLRPSRSEFKEMMRHWQTYSGTRTGAERHGFPEKQRRHSWVAAKVQLPVAPGGFARAASTRRFFVLEAGEQALPGGGELAFQCRPEARGHGLGEHRISSPGGCQQQQQRAVGAGDHNRARSGDNNDGATQMPRAGLS